MFTTNPRRSPSPSPMLDSAPFGQLSRPQAEGERGAPHTIDTEVFRDGLRAILGSWARGVSVFTAARTSESPLMSIEVRDRSDEEMRGLVFSLRSSPGRLEQEFFVSTTPIISIERRDIADTRLFPHFRQQRELWDSHDLQRFIENFR